MQFTRRGWELAAVTGVFIGLAVLAQQPIALYVGLGVAGYGLTRQYLAFRSFRATSESLSLTYSATRDGLAVDESVQLTLTVDRPDPAPTSIEIVAPLPVAATSQSGSDLETESHSVSESEETSSHRLSLPAGETTAHTTFACSFPIAGEFRFPEVRVHLTDATGRFREMIPWTDTPTVVVEPRTPTDVHVGQGGTSVAAYGEHEAGQRGTGITPAELRQYVPGDAKRRIDWNATARLNEPHVREFEAETDRETVLVVDARTTMAVGPAGQQMFDYAREVALGLVGLAEDNGDPLGCYILDDDELSTTPTTAAYTYRRVRALLHDRSVSTAEGSDPSSSRPTVAGQRPAVASLRTDASAKRALAGDDTAFAHALSPFLETAVDTVPIPGDTPSLVNAIERLHADRTGSRWTVLLTDDSDRAELRQAIRTARGGGDQVFVFLTPRVLFETNGLTDLDRAYERYADFERFRRELDRLGDVTVFEIGPGDRLAAVLDAQRERVSG